MLTCELFLQTQKGDNYGHKSLTLWETMCLLACTQKKRLVSVSSLCILCSDTLRCLTWVSTKRKKNYESCSVKCASKAIWM